MKKTLAVVLLFGFIVMLLFIIPNFLKNENNNTMEKPYDRAQVMEKASAIFGRIIAITQIDIGDGVISYEFLVQKGNTNNVISVVQTNELGLKPDDNVVLVTIDGKTRIRQKY